MANKSKKGRGKGGVGGPSIEFTPSDIDEIERMAGLGFRQEDIAQSLGVSYRTLIRHAKKNELLKKAYESGRLKAMEKVASTLFHLATVKKNPAAVFFYLRTQGGGRWTETKKVESHNVNQNENKHVGPAPVSISIDLGSVDDKGFDERLDKLAEKLLAQQEASEGAKGE